MVFGYMQAKEANMPMETLRLRSKASGRGLRPHVC